MTDPFKWMKRHLERLTYKWPPRDEAKKKGRRPSQLADKRTKWEHQCASCKKWFKDSQIHMDHITPKGKYDKSVFFEWLDKNFCTVEGFQKLCVPCHKKKTANEHKTGEYK